MDEKSLFYQFFIDYKKTDKDLDDKTKDLLATFLQSLSNSIIDFVKVSYVNEDLKFLLSNYNDIIKISHSLKIDDIEHSRVFVLGYLKAIFDVKSKADAVCQDNLQGEKILKNYKNLDNLINLLYEYKSLTHQELADKMNISKSNLYNLVNKYEITKLIVKEKYNRNVFYSLSSKGVSLYRVSVNKKSMSITADDYTSFIITLLKSIYNEINSDIVNRKRFWHYVTINIDTKIQFTKPDLVRNMLNNILDTLEKNSIYSPNKNIKLINNNKLNNSEIKCLYNIQVEG